MKKAIVFVLHNRPDYFKQTLDSWMQADGIEEYDIFFSIDTAGRDIDKQHISIIREYVTDMSTLHLHRPSLGMGHNQFYAMDKFFDKGYDFIINAEDDLVVSKDILAYFKSVIPHYIADNRCTTITANNFVVDKTKVSGYFKTKAWGSPWVWGITKEMWQNRVKPVWNSGNSLSWDIILGNALPDSMAIHPASSKTRNIGVWGYYNKGEKIKYFNFNDTTFDEDHHFGEYEDMPLDGKLLESIKDRTFFAGSAIYERSSYVKRF